MDLFHNAKTVRLKSHNKYLAAADDKVSVTVTEDRNGSSRSTEWTIEFIPESGHIILLKSCYDNYLRASIDHFLLGMTGRKVIQTRSLNDSSVQWEPIEENGSVQLKSWLGKYLRSNAGLPPWRNSVTHDTHGTQWDVHVVETVNPATASRIPRFSCPMDRLKWIALSVYSEWSEEQKREADNFFRQIDSNGDDKVSFVELRDKNIISNDLLNMFNKLDVNGNGTLDFHEILTLYYYKYMAAKYVLAIQPTVRFCKSLLCVRLRVKPDYSCFLCLARSLRRSYHLCSTCYDGGKHSHEHPNWCMLNRPALDLLDKMKYMLFEDYHKEAKKYNIKTVTLPAASISAITSTIAAGACTIQ